ncbi:hypothetical protein MLD38_021283 [Melastoma candidum]|uniref:Uncharacterized protein n=1 Tax=Melastoma candidum TaxID=119954 RepID=A0ACB9QG49_9MYRT|nr:hypothetical protein MLD38_021283 [Melastoma candidum]
MARLVAVQQQNLPASFSALPSSFSDFNGARLHTSIQYKRKVYQPKGALHVSASSSKKILIMGGTRFSGVFLSRLLVKEGHQVTLFTRGKAPITQQLPGESGQDYADFSSKIQHLKGDRKDFDFVKTSLAAEGFKIVYDINGREADEVAPILDALPNLEQFIYCSSAGAYLKSDYLPHFETDVVDPKSRHKGKLEAESLLQSRDDLATAFIRVLGNEKACKQVFNISGDKYVTFDGLAKVCAKAGGFPEPEIIHYNPKEFDFGKKAFPFRDQVTFLRIGRESQNPARTDTRIRHGGRLTDSYNLDFGRGMFRKEADFETNDIILGKSLVTA